MDVPALDSAVHHTVVAARCLDLANKASCCAGARIVIRAQRRVHRLLWLGLAIFFAGLLASSLQLRTRQNAPYETMRQSE